MDFITAPIITKATDPSKSAITQAIPIGDVISRSAPSWPKLRQI